MDTEGHVKNSNKVTKHNTSLLMKASVRRSTSVGLEFTNGVCGMNFLEKPSAAITISLCGSRVSGLAGWLAGAERRDNDVAQVKRGRGRFICAANHICLLNV